MTKITPWEPSAIAAANGSGVGPPTGPVEAVESGDPPGADRTVVSGWSLERRLPMLMFALLATIVLAFGFATYREVRTSAIERSVEHLQDVVLEVVGSAGRNQGTRVNALRSITTNPVVRRALVDSADRRGADSATVLLRQAHGPRDSTLLGSVLMSMSGQRRASDGDLGGARDSIMLAAMRAGLQERDSLRRSAMYAVDGSAHVWTMLPVRDGARTVGVLGELRKIANTARAEQSIRQIVGEDVRFHYASRDVDEWISVRGVPTDPLFPIAGTQGVAHRVTGSDGEAHYVVYASVPSTPWLLVLSQSEASVLRRPHELVRRLLMIGLVLLAFGTLAAWYMSRRVTEPLVAFGHAAEAMARGDYSHRVPLGGGREIARLASSFNTMSERIGDAQAVLEHQNSALQRANEAKTRFLAMMSHELRTPLNAIGGYTDLIAMGIRGPITPAQIEDLVRIRRNKDQLLNIIADILHFSRVDAGYVGIRLDDVHLADTFVTLGETIGTQFATKGVSLEIAETDAIVRADPARLQQVLLNLLTNAFNFTAPGGRVRVWSDTLGTWTQVHVQDTGIGIPAGKLAAIFEPFVQVDASLTRRVGGTGLGLPIARELTVAMGGTVSVESIEGEGTTFTIAVPSAGIPADVSAERVRVANDADALARS